MLRYSYSKKVNIRIILFYMNMGIFICCALYLINYYYQGYRSESKIDDLRIKMEQFDMNVDSSNDTAALQSIDGELDETSKKDNSSGKKTRKMLKSYVEAREKDYPYLVGRIKIEDTPIDYYVMQTPKDPEYFLRKDVTGEYNYEGTPFVDANCDLEKPSDNLIIYGHAMKNMHQFGSLRKYKNEDYYKEHPIISFETLYEKKCDYEIFATFYGKVYDEADKNVFRYYYYYGSKNQRDFDYYIDNIKEIACFDTGITPKYGDQIITLSTCNNEKIDNGTGRFVVVARKLTSADKKKNDKKATVAPTATPEPTKAAVATRKPIVKTYPRTTARPVATVKPTKKPVATAKSNVKTARPKKTQTPEATKEAEATVEP